MKKSQLKQLIKEEIENSPSKHQSFYGKKENLLNSINNSDIMQLLQYFSDYYKDKDNKLYRLFYSCYKQLDKIKNEIKNYHPNR